MECAKLPGLTIFDVATENYLQMIFLKEASRKAAQQRRKEARRKSASKERAKEQKERKGQSWEVAQPAQLAVWVGNSRTSTPGRVGCRARATAR